MAIELTPYFSREGIGAASPSLVNASQTTGAVVGQALGQVAAAADVLAEEEAVRSAGNAALDTTKAISDFEESLKTRQDYGSFNDDYARFWRQHRNATLSGLSYRARQKVEAKLDYLGEQGRISARGAAWNKQTEVGRADLLRQTDQAFEVIGRDPNSPQAQEAFAGLQDLYAGAASTETSYCA